MKKVRGGVIVSVVLALGLGGCASAPPETQCFKVVNGIAVTVDTSMKVAGDLYGAGKINDAQKAQILALHAKYQKAILAAGHGCTLIQDSKDITKLTGDAQAALAELLGLIALFKGGQ